MQPTNVCYKPCRAISPNKRFEWDAPTAGSAACFRAPQAARWALPRCRDGSKEQSFPDFLLKERNHEQRRWQRWWWG